MRTAVLFSTLIGLTTAAPTRADEPAAEPVPPPPAAAALGSPAEELGYALGYRIGSRIIADHRALGTPLDAAALARGLADAVREVPPQLDEKGFQRVLADFERRMDERDRELAARMEEAAKTNLAEGVAFLEANGKRPGVVTLPSGLQYEVLRQGEGPKPGPDAIVLARYRGTRIDGEEFDGTDPAGEPASFPVRRVVPGWQEALQLMPVGSKWRLWLPAALGYGESGSPPAIEPNEVLVFELELVGIQPAGR